MQHPNPSMIYDVNKSTVNGSAPRAGPVAVNAGALRAAKISPLRAFQELPLNAIDAGGEQSVTAVEIITTGYNPLHPTGSDEHQKCMVVYSNTMVPEGKMEAALNYGTTRGTEEGHRNQSDGNHFGVGLKEAAIAFGGTPGMINMTQTANQGEYVVTGAFVDPNIGKCYQSIEGTVGTVVCKASFKCLVTDKQPGARPEVNILFPTSSDGLDKKLLYHSGLAFCVEGSRFDQCDMLLQSDKLIAKNMERLENTICNTFVHTMKEYRDAQISRLMTVSENLLVCGLTNRCQSRQYVRSDGHTMSDSESAELRHALLLEQFSSITMCFMLGIDASYFHSCSCMQSGMGEEFDGKIQAHIMGLEGSKLSLSTHLACKVNFDYYREVKRRDIIITLDGKDVRESNPYTPIACISKAIRNAVGPKEMRYEIPIVADDPHTLRSVNYGTLSLAQSQDWCGTKMVDMVEGRLHGMPRIDSLESGETQVTWPNYDTARDRAPPPGILFEVDGIVYNADNPTGYFDSPNLFLNVPDIEKGTGPYSRAANPEAGLRNGPILSSEKIIKDLFMLARMSSKDSGRRLTPSELEYKLNHYMFKNHLTAEGLPKPYLMDAPFKAVSHRLIEFMTCTDKHLQNTKLGGFPKEGSVATKWVIQSIYGMNVSGIFRFNKDVMSQTVDKSVISLAINSMFVSNAFLREMRLAMMCYAMNYCISSTQLVRMKHIMNNVDLTPPMEYARHTSESETSIVPVADHITTDIPPAVVPYPIVSYDHGHPATWDAMSLEDWVTYETFKTKPLDGMNKTIDKMSTRDGWKVFWEASNRADGPVKYFTHSAVFDLFKMKGIRTHQAVFEVNTWLQSGGVENLAAFPPNCFDMIRNSGPFKERVRIALGDALPVLPPKPPKHPKHPKPLKRLEEHRCIQRDEVEDAYAERSVRQRLDPDKGQETGGPMHVDYDEIDVPDHRYQKVNDLFFRLWQMAHTSLEKIPDPPFIFYHSLTTISKNRLVIAVEYNKRYMSLSDNCYEEIEMKKTIKDVLSICMRKTSTVDGAHLLVKTKERVAKLDSTEPSPYGVGCVSSNSTLVEEVD